MKIELTEETRPRRSGGVSVWTSVDRMRTLMLSNIPLSTSSAIDKPKLRENPKPTIGRGPGFVVVRQSYTWNQPYAPREKAGSVWD